MKQIKTLALAAALLLLAAGCTDERDNGGTGNIPPGTPVEINFDAPTVANNGTATRAATTVPLPANTTVRITPYNKTKNRYETSLTYYVGTPADGKGKLIPYTSQNADGTFVAGTKMKVIMSDTYQFYISTPAKDITSEGYKQTVGNNEDYASAVSGDVLITGNFVTNGVCPTLPTLVRRCAQITVEIMPASMQIASAPGGVKLSGLRSAQAGIAPGAAIPTTGGTYDQSYTVTTLQSENVGKLLYNSFCVLPGVSTATITAQLVAILKPDGVNEVRKTVTYSAKLNFVEALKPGYRYQVRLVAETENAEMLPTVTVTDWDMTGGDLKPDPSNHYPYVTTNAEGEMSIIVLQDVFGGVMDVPDFSTKGCSLHEPWLQTPTHAVQIPSIYFGIAGSSSRRFEVSKIDLPVGEGSLVHWESTNYGCTAPWRRPTYFEAEAIMGVNDKLSAPLKEDEDYWTATETVDGSTITSKGQKFAKISSAPNRCVRDFFDIKRSGKFHYPYVMEGKYIVFYDGFEQQPLAEHGGVGLHGKWEQTPWCDALAYLEASQVYKGTIEVSDVTHPLTRWLSPNGPCISPWRAPTIAELLLILKLNDYLNIPNPPNIHLWTAANDGGEEAEEYKGVLVSPGGEEIVDSMTEGNTRCIRDL